MATNSTIVVPEDTEEQGFDRVLAVVQRSVGEPTEAQLELIRAQYVDQTYLDSHPVFVFQAEVSNNQLDAYWTRMHESSLRNFVEDAQRGVAFMNSHRTGGIATDAEQPYGRSFDATLIGAGGRGNARQRVEEWFYIPRAAMPNGPGRASSDNIIESILTGTGRDISIGFHGGEFRCSICDRDMGRDWACWHMPGFSYAVQDKDGKDTDQQVTALAWIHNAHQVEASSVYDGATPGCMVKKALRMADDGVFKRDMIDLLEQRYRIHIPYRMQASGVTLPQAQEEHMANENEERSAPTEQPQGAENPAVAPIDLSGLRTALSARGVSLQSSVADIELVVRTLLDENARMAEFCTDENRRWVDEGKHYRQTVTDDALKELVRTYAGTEKTPPVEMYRALFQNASLEHIETLRDDWRAQADRVIPSGRTTTERAPDDEKKESTGRRIPAGAFKS